ncbi:MAG: S9 family peptidase, partial [Candidatus Krumholzibacteria bacterium]|nr:S9 family peptidase [Candidatus Krumholzibacteria bacterium]
KVTDPYQWLEDDNAEEVKAWVGEQNSVTFSYLDNISFRDKIKKRIEELYNYPKYSSPMRAGDYYFFYKNDGLQNQSVIYIQKSLEGEPEVFIDPNKLSEDGTVRIGLIGFSNDDRYVAFARSDSGSDWCMIGVMEIATKKELSDQLHWVKFSRASWYGDGFFYNGYDEPEEGAEFKGQNKYMKIFYHKLGEPQEKDVLVWEDREHPLRFVWADVTEKEEYIFLSVTEGTSGNEIYYRKLDGVKGEFLPLIRGFENDSYAIENIGDKFLVFTNIDADNNRLVLVDSKNPEITKWKTIIPEKPMVLNWVSTAGGQLFCNYLEGAYTHVYHYGIEGSLVREIELPTLGSAYGFNGKREEKTLFYIFTSFTYPSTIYKYDIESGKSEVFHKSGVKFDPEDYEAKQVFFTSKDGTRVPMFIVHKKGLALDGRNPAYLTGYGGFDASMTPYFSATRIVLLENGCVVAMPNLRGGGEYGEEWHKSGMLHNKQNVFDDFIAAAEFLISEKYTSSDLLAISGASNGGLLDGACMTQRPDLFKVALPAVGVMDMLRYHKFTVGWGWVVEYGTSDKEEHFETLLAYSPLHNIKEGGNYPATFVTTADHDDRVVPAHS